MRAELPDDRLAAELAAAFADRRAPTDVVEAAKGLFTWRTIDAELAALTFDSLVDEEEAAVRSGDEPRTLTFETPDRAVECEIVPAGVARRLVGQLDPPGPTEVVVELDGSPQVVPVDEIGRFAADLPGRPVEIALRVGVDLRTTPVRV